MPAGRSAIGNVPTVPFIRPSWKERPALSSRRTRPMAEPPVRSKFSVPLPGSPTRSPPDGPAREGRPAQTSTFRSMLVVLNPVALVTVRVIGYTPAFG